MAEEADEGLRLWQTQPDMDAESKSSYQAGAATFIQVPVDGKPVMALLLSYELGQRMLKCVRLQRAHDELVNHSNAELAATDKEIAELQDLDHSSEDERYVRVSGPKKKFSELSEVIRQLQEEKAKLGCEANELKEQWYNYMESILTDHDDAFIKAGILPDYANSESKDPLDGTPEFDKEATELDEAVENLDDEPDELVAGATNGDARAIATDFNPNAKKDTMDSDDVNSQSRLQDLDIFKSCREAEIKSRLLAAREAFQAAESAHEYHRSMYRYELDKFIKDNPAYSVEELATLFGPLWIKRGRGLICALRDAEEAFVEAEKRAIDADLFTLPETMIERDVNPYLDVEDLMVMCTDRKDPRILKWGHVGGGMLPPPTICTIETFENLSSRDDTPNLERITGIPSETGTTEDKRFLAESDASFDEEPKQNDVAPLKKGKRIFCGEIQTYESQSIAFQGVKQQRIDAWAREGARWRNRNL